MTDYEIITTDFPTHSKFYDLSGRIFKNLTVLRFLGQSHYGAFVYECRCVCGIVIQARAGDLHTDRIRSCGCSDSQRLHRAHGMSKTKVYATWRRIMQRTGNPNHVFYHNYGGRGIKVCERWMQSFDAFLADMGEPPTPEHTIDRIDTDGDYTPENCHWATRQEQASNRRNTVYLTYQGQTLRLVEWAKQMNIRPSTLNNRIRAGWNLDKAMTTPIRLTNR